MSAVIEPIESAPNFQPFPFQESQQFAPLASMIAGELEIDPGCALSGQNFGYLVAEDVEPDEGTEKTESEDEGDGFDRDDDDDGLITWTEVEQPTDDFDENDFDDDFDDDFESDMESEEFEERDGDLDFDEAEGDE